MSVSVIIPAYKARNYLAQAMQSVGQQSLQPAEVIVVDDCSPEAVDDILALFRERPGYPDIRVVRHEKNQGLGAARNSGIAHAQSEWVAFLDHDDVWSPEHLAGMLKTLKETMAEMAYRPVLEFTDDTQTAKHVWGPASDTHEGNFDIRLYKDCFITPSAVVAKKELLLRMGGFSTDPKVHMCEDLDLWLRMRREGIPMAFAPEPWVYYRKHPGGATSRPGYMAYQAAYVRQLHFPTARGGWFCKRVILAKYWWAACRVHYRTQNVWPKEPIRRALVASWPVPWVLPGALYKFAMLVIKA